MMLFSFIWFSLFSFPDLIALLLLGWNFILLQLDYFEICWSFPNWSFNIVYILSSSFFSLELERFLTDVDGDDAKDFRFDLSFLELRLKALIFALFIIYFINTSNKYRMYAVEINSIFYQTLSSLFLWSRFSFRPSFAFALFLRNLSFVQKFEVFWKRDTGSAFLTLFDDFSLNV